MSTVQLDATVKYKIVAANDPEERWRETDASDVTNSLVVDYDDSIQTHFKVVASSCGDPDTFSLRTVETDNIVRHSAHRVNSQVTELVNDWSEDACWRLHVPGLCGEAGTISIESNADQGKFICLRPNSELWVDEINDTAEDRSTACWKLISVGPLVEEEECNEQKPCADSNLSCVEGSCVWVEQCQTDGDCLAAGYGSSVCDQGYCVQGVASKGTSRETKDIQGGLMVNVSRLLGLSPTVDGGYAAFQQLSLLDQVATYSFLGGIGLAVLMLFPIVIQVIRKITGVRKN